MQKIYQFSQTILSWYDHNRRRFIWRQSTVCDPYKVWLSEMMLQQTTTATVGRYYEYFLKRWPTVNDLAATSLDSVLHAWQGLGYYARARNLHRCAKEIVEKYQGSFPDSETELVKLPGIGPYSAAAITAIAFNKPAVVLDTNIIRIISRIFTIEDIIKPATPGFNIVKEKAASIMPEDRPGDYAQALMDLGATICTAKNPKCLLCPVQQFCQAFALGIQDALPLKPIKSVRPIRKVVFWIIFSKQGRIAFVKRPEKGLLGGLMTLPLNFLDEVKQESLPFPFAGEWQRLSDIQHVFTHFTAHVQVYNIDNIDENSFQADCWCSASEIASLALPTFVKKALKNIF